jgi:SOS-response transcriptional repressor LexA
LKFIQDYLDRHDVSPSFEEMRDALKLKSKSGIHRLITGLEERGYVRRLAYRARALEVVRLPNSMQKVAGGDLVDTDAGNVVHGRFGGLRPSEPANAGTQVALPLFGRIAAGTPITALQDNGTQVEIPQHMVKNGEHYALEVVGDSMVEAGILDGDIRRPHERPRTQAQGIPQADHTAYKGRPDNPAPVECAAELCLVNDDLAFRIAHGNGGGVRATHHHALNDRLTAIIKLDFAFGLGRRFCVFHPCLLKINRAAQGDSG